MNFLQKYNKALAVPLTAVVLALLGHFGIVPTMTVQDAITALITTLVVYYAPKNKEV